jgi:hypothetical protein
MSQTESKIEFTIQRLDGETFTVNIYRLEAGFYWIQSLESQYNNFGLDILKDAICVQNGADPVTQQLFCEKELTISDSLIPLENKLITLIIKPSFRIEFGSNDESVRPRELYTTLHFDYGANFRPLYSVLCYLYCPSFQNVSIEVIGQYRDFFKIATNNLPHHLLRQNWSKDTLYTIPNETLKYIWLRYHNRSMKIV